MNYFSTRDKSLKFSFKDIFLRGLAPGGGLFLPHEIKKYNQEELNNLSQLNYNELATEIIFNFCSGEIKKEELNSLIQKSYSSFKDKEVVNIKKIGNINLLELYHGPTLAFKDIAMQVIGNLYDYLEVAKVKTVNVRTSNINALYTASVLPDVPESYSNALIRHTPTGSSCEAVPLVTVAPENNLTSLNKKFYIKVR